MELSSIGLRFRGNQAPAADVSRALEPVHHVLKELAAKNALDEKLAEYAFFPLSHVFNETQRLSARCLELAVESLRLLVAHGWRQRLSPAMGKQLIILLTLIVGGSPNKAEEKRLPQPRVQEELAIAGYNCLHAIFAVLEGPVAQRTIFHEIGTATVVDQTVYILLEGLVDERSDELCLAAAKALQALYNRITDRVVLASIMPRTVSALVKVVKPTTQTRRSYKVLETSLQVLAHLLRAVLNDQVATEVEKPASIQSQSDEMTLDGSWLKATITQIKLALANVIQVRRHQRSEVRGSLMDLCLMIIEECQVTLKESIPMMAETIVVLAENEEEAPNKAFNALIYLSTTYPVVLDSLKESLHNWLTSFPRIMQSNDETAKQWGIRQISTVYQVLSQAQVQSDILTSGLAIGLCDSVGAVLEHGGNAREPLALTDAGNLSLDVLGSGSQTMTFPPVLLEHRSQEQTLKDLRSMITRLNMSESGNEITRLVVNRLHATSEASMVAPFWLALTALRAQSNATAGFDDLIVDDFVENPLSRTKRAGMIEELYYVSLTILNDLSADGSGDWRTMALALEAVALQAQQLGEAFRPELMDALYPTLQLLASNNRSLQQHAMTCLNILTTSCNYPDTSSMIIENVDYLVNSVALKLNTFDVSPYPPQVLHMMVKLCGARLIPYLDDLVESIFGILDMYHGYPKLVEMMFKTLASIVEEGAKKPSLLTIDDGRENGPHDSWKTQYQHLSVSTVAADIRSRKAKQSMMIEKDEAIDGQISHPTKPWSETYEKPEAEPESIEELLRKAESDEPLPPPKEPDDTERPLSKTHSLLLHIVKSIPLHLASPSPYLRRSLLSILAEVLPTLSQNENSFLPLINDLWPSVASRIVFPSSIGSEKSPSNTLTTRDRSEPNNALRQDTHAPQEEAFVMTAACQAVEVMCKGGGDFMASRMETEFPRWARLYEQNWARVRQEAEAAKERRARQQQVNRQHLSNAAPSHTSSCLTELDLALAPASSLALATTSPGIRASSQHHVMWRALLTLFVTVLGHVRLPLEYGDRICEMLGDWIVVFVGPDYYFSPSRRAALPGDLGEAQKQAIEFVKKAIRAMETWNLDLTWFVFASKRKPEVSEGRQPVESLPADLRPQKPLAKFEAFVRGGARGVIPMKASGEEIHFAEMIF